MMTSSRQRRDRDRVARVLEQMAQSGPNLTATAHGRFPPPTADRRVARLRGDGSA
jgi:hypothetical protein